MKLASYQWQSRSHVGFFSNDRLYSLTAAAEGAAWSGFGKLKDMTDFLRQGESALEWARGLENSINGSNVGLVSCPLSDVKLLPPVTNPEKIICIGKNYADHAQETGSECQKNLCSSQNSIQRWPGQMIP